MVCTCPTIHLVIWEATTAIGGAHTGLHPLPRAGAHPEVVDRCGSSPTGVGEAPGSIHHGHRGVVCTCSVTHSALWKRVPATVGASGIAAGIIERATAETRSTSRGTIPSGAPGGSPPGRLASGVLRRDSMGALVISGSPGLLSLAGAGRMLVWAPTDGMMGGAPGGII